MEPNKPPPANQPVLAIDLQHVDFLREDMWILRDISWQVLPGACVAILGPNGSGKSTLARIIGCHVWPTRGQVSILGQRFGETNLARLRTKIRLVQPAGPYDIELALSARDVVLTGFFGSLNLYDKPTEAMLAGAARVLALVGLTHVADHSYATLSSGERVRNLLARALVQGPRLLLLDEPTNGLDLLAREQVLATIQQLAQSPDAPTIVLITHHVEELPPATSQVLLMDEGRVGAQGTPEQVLRDEVLSRVYRCPVQVRRSGKRYYLEVTPAAWDDLLNGRFATTHN